MSRQCERNIFRSSARQWVRTNGGKHAALVQKSVSGFSEHPQDEESRRSRNGRAPQSAHLPSELRYHAVYSSSTSIALHQLFLNPPKTGDCKENLKQK